MIYVQYKHYFKDLDTNETFPIETSFAIPHQALHSHWKYKLAGFDDGNRERRFELIQTKELETVSYEKE